MKHLKIRQFLFTLEILQVKSSIFVWTLEQSDIIQS